MSTPPNPIQRRLAMLAEQWAEFAQLEEARVLCWLLAYDEHAMVDAFVTVESEEATGETQDLFVSLRAPFVPGQYGAALLTEFVDAAQALHAGLEDADTPAWVPPPVAAGAPDPLPLLRACESFADHYELPGLLVLVLTPASISDAGAFAQWLDLVTRSALPHMPKLRLLVRDDVQAPRLTALVKAQPTRVQAVPANLDMPGAREEISENAGNLDKPGGQFRQQFVQLTNALGKQDLPVAERHATAALSIAAAEKWFALAVPIHFAMASGLSAGNRPEEASQRYQQAEAAAVEGEKAGDPFCAKLRVQARMGRGSLLIKAAAWRPAAALFEETLPLAQALQDPGLIIDCHRLASLCHEQQRQWPQAWQHAVDGLAYARTVEPKVLTSTSLAYLGEAFARLCKRGEYSGSWARVDKELTQLLGPDWRARGATGAA